MARKNIWATGGLLLMWALGFSQIQFTEVGVETGVGMFGPNHGIAVGDFDQDGWEDVYVSCRMGPNRLFRNLAGNGFEDVAPALGLDHRGDSRLALWGDINNDGWPDLYLGTETEGDYLYLNEGGEQFRDISLSAGMLIDVEPTMAAMFGDLDNDGWLDLYCARHYSTNTLYRNLGDLTFEDRIASSGANDTLAAMGGILFDYDNDQDLDLYLVHDAKFPNLLFRNEGAFTFTDVSAASGADFAGFGMGVDVADINRDGWLDLYITNFFENTLLVNRGDGTFEDLSLTAGVDDIGMGWGTTFVDVDNDGWKDIYLVNSKVANDLFPNYPNVLYRNLGGNQFEKVSENTPLASRGNAFGLASGDFDQNGWVDLLIATMQDTLPNELLENHSSFAHHWVEIKLIGEKSNHMAIGAKVSLKTEEAWQTDLITAGSSWASQNSPVLHFGLGEYEQIDSLIVAWPSGQRDVWTEVAADQRLTLREAKEETAAPPPTLELYPNPVSPQERI
ncbi:MAG: CRTAC1 family protein, partial [Bacteroidota bacterium]